MLFKQKASLMISQGMGDSKSSFQKGLPQFVAVMVKNILLVSFGMTLGYPTILIPSLTSGDRNEEIQLTPEQVSWIDKPEKRLSELKRPLLLANDCMYFNQI
uniref:Uncharacterized protein n=1 Tax=Photinus pyralis TaxID=7054 RepID=A0A1Y1KY53_PHOPY